MTDQLRPEAFRQRLNEYLEAVSGRPVTITALEPLPGGSSRDSWLVSLRSGDAAEKLVLRRDLATAADDRALERDQEFKVMQAAHAAGLKVPRPRWYCTEPLILDAPFVIMDFIEGYSLGVDVVDRPELADARAALPEQLGEQLARIHALDPNAHGLDFLPAPRPGFSPAQEALAQVRAQLLKLGVYNPIFAFGLRWAETHLPAAGRVTLLHGDFRVGNFLVTPDGLNGIVDWEFCRLGDPLEDLAWACLRDWRYGRGMLRFGGIARREPFLQAYERASGQTVDRQALDFWEIVGNLRRAVTCLVQADRHLSGGDISVELASLGRRSAEMQLEMLRLIDEQGV